MGEGRSAGGLARAGRSTGGPAVVGSGAWSARVHAVPNATYWRRRCIVLAVGLAILAAAAWRLSEALRVAPARTQGSSGTHATSARSPGGRPARAASSAPSPTASGLAGLTPAPCSLRSIVLSLSANQIHFAPGQKPAFSLTVVSTQPTACSFNLGTGHLAVVIKQGTGRIWSSADCAGGGRSIVTTLTRGVPTVESIGWNKKRSASGCSGQLRAASAGTYTAYAVDGSLVSAPVTLRLS